MSRELRAALSASDIALADLLRARGFDRVTRGRYVLRLPDGLFGTFGVTTKAVRDGDRDVIDLYPMIGVGHSGIADITHDLVPHVPPNRASVSVGLGYLTPAEAWIGYRIGPEQDYQEAVAKMLRDFDAHAAPFLARHKSIADVIETMCEFWGGDLIAQDLPIAYCLNGSGQTAREYVAGYIAYRPPKFLRLHYIPFLEKLRERLLPPPLHTDDAFGLDLAAAVRQKLPIDLTLLETLEFWRLFVAEVETGCDRTFTEYQNAIGLRELLESTTAKVPKLDERLRPALLVLDAAFRSATTDATDDGARMGSAWWWNRLPARPGPRLQRSLAKRGLTESMTRQGLPPN